MIDSIYTFTTICTENFVEIKKKVVSHEDKRTRRKEKYSILIVWKGKADCSGYL